jgi:lipopolysaccharide export system protein LptA
VRASLLVLLVLAAHAPAGTASAAARTIELRGDEVILSQSGGVVEARGRVRITAGAIRMSADRAVYLVRARRITLSGHVTVSAPQGDLEADAARAELGPGNALETVEASGRVTLEAQQRVVRAGRMTYAIASGAVSADGGVEVFMPPDVIGRGRTLVMKSGEAATLQGRARIQTRDGYVESDRIDFSERRQVAFARGNVVGVFEETRITAAAATFYGRERRAVFRDGVRMTRPGRTIQAQVVTIYLQERRIVAEGETTIRLEDQPQRP